MILLYMIKGSCQVKLIQKSEKNSDWPDINHPPPPIHFLKKKNGKKIQKKKESNPS